MSINNAVTLDLRQIKFGNFIETDTLVFLHCTSWIHVVARPEVIEADPLFRKYYTGRRRFKRTSTSKEAHCKDGTVHLSIDARSAMRADDAFQLFMGPIRDAARTLS